MSNPIMFLTPEQYNQIYTGKSGIAITSKIDERIQFLLIEANRLQKENDELKTKHDKATTQMVSYEATIGHLKDGLLKIANDKSPPWDNMDYKGVAKECLRGIFKPE